MNLKQSNCLLVAFALLTIFFLLFYFGSGNFLPHYSKLTSRINFNVNNEKTNLTTSDRHVNEDLNTLLIKNNSCNYGKKGARILCTVFTTRASHSTRMKAIHDTWSKRFLFFDCY